MTWKELASQIQDAIAVYPGMADCEVDITLYGEIDEWADGIVEELTVLGEIGLFRLEGGLQDYNPEKDEADEPAVS